MVIDLGTAASIENMSQNVCWFNRFGYCRFGNHCFRKHINIICENVNCEIAKCSSRHPRKCKYFLEYQKCKFGEYCRFSHGIPNNPKNMEKIEALEKEVEVLKQEIKHMKDHFDMKESQLKMIQTEVNEKVVIIQKVELASKYLEKELEDSKTEIRLLLDKIDIIEEVNKTLEIEAIKAKKETDVLKEDLDKKNKETEFLKDTLTKNKEEREALILKINQTNNKAEEESNKEEVKHLCYKCEFIGKSKEDLRTHVIATHMKKAGQSIC